MSTPVDTTFLKAQNPSELIVYFTEKTIGQTVFANVRDRINQFTLGIFAGLISIYQSLTAGLTLSAALPTALGVSLVGVLGTILIQSVVYTINRHIRN